jgi:hypothetical protein
MLLLDELPITFATLASYPNVITRIPGCFRGSRSLGQQHSSLVHVLVRCPHKPSTKTTLELSVVIRADRNVNLTQQLSLLDHCTVLGTLQELALGCSARFHYLLHVSFYVRANKRNQGPELRFPE